MSDLHLYNKTTKIKKIQCEIFQKSAEVFLTAEIRLYEETRVRDGSKLSEELTVTMGIHQGTVLSTLLLMAVVDLFTELREDGRVLRKEAECNVEGRSINMGQVEEECFKVGLSDENRTHQSS